MAELDKAIISEASYSLPSGGRKIIRKIEPPVVEAEAANVPAEPTPEQVAQFQAYAAKAHHTVMLSVTIYGEALTRLEWTHGGEAYLAYTNVNFDYLRSASQLETETERFLFFMGIGELDLDQLDLTDVPVFNPGPSSYLLLEGDPNNAEALAGVDLLLAHYDANEAQLKIEHQRRGALASARLRYDASHSEVLEDIVTHFWRPVRSTSTSGKAVSE